MIQTLDSAQQKDGSTALKKEAGLVATMASKVCRKKAVTKTRTGLGLDWRWTGAFLILNPSEQLF